MITGDLKDITFDQVVEFLGQGVKEGLTLDYKLFDSKSIARVACAFANSYGGIIIVGVAESNEAPAPPFDGLENIRSMKQSIRDTVLRLVFPTIWMELADVVNPETNKGFIIARVPRSDNAPHAYDNREIYTRYQDRNNPSGKKTQLAELNWIEATIRSRSDKEKQIHGKIASFETLVTRLQNRYDKQIPTSDTPSLCCVILCPEFDISGDVSTSELLAFLKRVRQEQPTQSLLLNSSTALRTLHDGVYAIPRQGERLPTEQKSLLVFKDDGFSACAFCAFSAGVKVGDSQIPNSTRLDKILTVVEKFLELNGNVYRSFGMVGALRVRIILRNVAGTVGLLPPPGCENEQLHYFLHTPTYRQIEGDFEVIHNAMSYELFGGESTLLTDLRTRLADSFNVE